jgi:hypothetical protein
LVGVVVEVPELPQTVAAELLPVLVVTHMGCQ